MRRNIADIMIARNIVDRYLRVDLVRDAEILCDLGRVPRLIDQVPYSYTYRTADRSSE